MRWYLALAAGLAISGFAASGWAQTAGTSAGPGRIVCDAKAACDLDIGTPPKLRYRVDASGLPETDKARLTKDCTAKGKPCIATVQGSEGKDPMQVKAAKITWYN